MNTWEDIPPLTEEEYNYYESLPDLEQQMRTKYWNYLNKKLDKKTAKQVFNRFLQIFD